MSRVALPSYYASARNAVFADFSSAGGYAGITVSEYTATPPPGHSAAVTNGALEINFTNWSSGSAFGANMVPTSGTWDFSQARLALEIESGGESDYLENCYFRVRLGDAGFSWAYDWNPAVDAIHRKGPKMIIPLPFSTAAVSGTPSLTTSARLLVYLYGQTNPWVPNQHKLRITRIFSYYRTRPKVIMMFDDGRSSVFDYAYNTSGKMKDQEVPGTIYLPTDFPDTAGFMTSANFDTVYADGWDVANQNDSDWKMAGLFTTNPTIAQAGTGAVSGAVDMQDWGSLAVDDVVTIYGADPSVCNGQVTITSASYSSPNWTIGYNVTLPYSVDNTPDTVALGHVTLMKDPTSWNATNVAAYEAGRDWLRGRGYTRACDHYAYSGGIHNSSVVAALASAGMITGRTTLAGSTVFPGCHVPSSTYAGMHVLPAKSLDSVTSATALGYVDKAIETGSTLMLYCHGAEASYFTTANFDAFLTGLVLRRNQGLIDCVTISDWYSGLSGTRPAVSRLSDAAPAYRPAVSRLSV